MCASFRVLLLERLERCLADFVNRVLIIGLRPRVVLDDSAAFLHVQLAVRVSSDSFALNSLCPFFSVGIHITRTRGWDSQVFAWPPAVMLFVLHRRSAQRLRQQDLISMSGLPLAACKNRCWPWPPAAQL